ncbi:MAG: NADH-quinone oxidoreductase subunit NuoF [Chloroflexi bacterium HGW-Chloroflexi-8]|nr:MAG: NADH-quinone oxidoreductase subunit NuoF [Chloroflexi bacterium HGW-Chloroflexi-8]
MSNPTANVKLALEELRDELMATYDPSKPCVTVCAGTGCCASGALEVKAALDEEIKKQGADVHVDIKITGCRGFCEQGPLVAVLPTKIFYTKVKQSDAAQIIAKTILKGEIIDKLLYKDPVTGEKITHETDIPFYKEQHRILLHDSGSIDPTSFEDYLIVGGYKALAKALLTMQPVEIIEEVNQSGLGGRGGAGFPTGKKWQLCRQAPGTEKYVIVNADEGDPGAFQDRSLIEANPHSVLEGFIIGAFAIGANHGYVYIRHEYPLAVERIKIAINKAREHGLLGKNILGSGFDFDVTVQMGAGAFVCGEETALMASIEGFLGEPHARPPYPAQSGLWGKPTNINNVKTWATVPYIINKGAGWYSQMGTETSKGTTIFSLVGKINNTGLVEVPMGISLRDLIEKVGGGSPSEKKLKAVQTGGPSGGCIPESLWDVPVDYKSLGKLGSIMGSGGMIVMDESTCMVDIARYFLNFSRFESCGKCTACREGVTRMYETLDYITRGYGQEGDIEQLEELCKSIKAGSLCGLGQTAPNPVLTTIKYFREEYEAHIREKTCPAGVCKELITFYILPDKCTGCSLCARYCGDQAISGEKGGLYVIDPDKCQRCGVCREVCNFDAVVVR